MTDHRTAVLQAFRDYADARRAVQLAADELRKAQEWLTSAKGLLDNLASVEQDGDEQ